MAKDENNTAENEQKNDVGVDDAPEQNAEVSPGQDADQEVDEEENLETQMAASMAVEGDEESGDDDLEAEMAATMALETEADDDDLDLEAQMAAAMQGDGLEEAFGAKHRGGNAAAHKVSPQRLDFQQLRPTDEMTSVDNIDRLMDVTLSLSVEIGRKQMQIKEILSLGPGKIIELDKLAGEPVDLLVNGKMLAKGEVVVVDENFGVRITDLINPQDRIKML